MPNNTQQRKMWVGQITHKHGVNLYASETDSGLLKQISDYCAEWWEDAEKAGAGNMPSNRAVIIQRYFEFVESEWFDTEQVEVK